MNLIKNQYFAIKKTSERPKIYKKPPKTRHFLHGESTLKTFCIPKTTKSRETNTFYYKFCETNRLKISMRKDRFFQWENLDVKRPKNYFYHLFFTEKSLKNPYFSAFLGHFDRFWFHMKHTLILPLFHVKHMFFDHFSPIFTPVFLLLSSCFSSLVAYTTISPVFLPIFCPFLDCFFSPYFSLPTCYLLDLHTTSTTLRYPVTCRHLEPHVLLIVLDWFLTVFGLF